MQENAIKIEFIRIPKSSLVCSVLLHGGLLSVAWITHLIAPKLGFILSSPEKKVIHESYIQVDVVGLPDTMMDYLANTDTTLPIVDNVAEPVPDLNQKIDQAEMVEEQSKEAKRVKDLEEKSAQLELKKIKKSQALAMSRLKEEQKRLEALKALKVEKGQAGRKTLKGNIASQGTAVRWAIGEAKDKWISMVAESIKNQFSIYPWQKSKKLSAVVAISLYPNGRVRERKIEKSSGDATYDSAVLRAIEAAEPLPIPADAALLEEPLIIELRPES